jgi:hypothetical protein
LNGSELDEADDGRRAKNRLTKKTAWGEGMMLQGAE